MKYKVFALLFLLTAMCSPAWPGVYQEGEALAVFRVDEGVSVSEAVVNVADIGASVAETYEALSEIGGNVIVLVRSPSMTTDELIASLKSRPDVITASPNYYAQRLSVNAARLPNDPSADLCWGLDAIRAPEVWNITTGNRMIHVAVVDTGLYIHPDLEDNIAPEYCLNTTTVSEDFDMTFTSWDMDFIGHGTHVAGTIGAVGNNGIGVSGVNWNVSMFSVRVFDKKDVAETISNEIRALNHIAALLRNNPSMRIAAVNFSLGSALPISPENMKNDVYYMAYQALDSLNRTMIVAGAGNSGLEVGSPALFDDPGGKDFKEGTYFYPASFTGLNNLIVVGATDSGDKAASFTNWGDKVDIAAPGVGILSTHSPLADNSAGRYYAVFSGTSMAAPHVTGAVALLASAYPDATPGQIKSALLEGANKDKNPIVYPYTYMMEGIARDIVEKVLSDIGEGIIPIESADVEIARLNRIYAERYEPYRQFDGVGHVSRTGLLDVKAAYEILDTSIRKGSGSSSGCNAGIPAMMIIFAGIIAAASRKNNA